jgi:hypothetical protein
MIYKTLLTIFDIRNDVIMIIICHFWCGYIPVHTQLKGLLFLCQRFSIQLVDIMHCSSILTFSLSVDWGSSSNIPLRISVSFTVL